MHLPVVAGGQRTIDQGVVAHYRSADFLPPVSPGAPGAYWLAAHDLCGLFATVPALDDGADITITTTPDGATFHYRVESRESFLPQVSFGDLYRYGDRPYLMLQTCIPRGRRLIIYATLV